MKSGRFPDAILPARIASRLIFYIVCLGLVFTVVGTLASVYMEYRARVRDIEHRFDQLEAGSVPGIVNSLWVANRSMLAIQLEGLSQLPDLEYLEVLDGDEVVARAGRLPDGRRFERRIELGYEYRGRHVDLGELLVVASDRDLRADLADRSVTLLVLQAASIFLISILILVLFQKLAGRHIFQMAEYARNLDLEPTTRPLALDRRSRGGDDELDALVNAINDMRTDLMASFAEMQEANASLEREIASHQQTVSALRRSEGQLLTAQHIAQLGSWDYDIEKDLFELQGETARIHGLSADVEDIGLSALRAVVHPEHRDYVREVWARMLETGSAEYEYRIVQPSGEVRWLWGQGEAVTDGEGRAMRLRGVVLDVTDRKVMEMERSELREQLQEAQKIEALGTLAGGIAHDFNNILAAILGYASLAASEAPENDSLKDYMKQILAAGHRASDLVKQILAFGRRDDRMRRVIRLDDVVREALRLLRATLPANVDIRLDRCVEGATVEANPTQIHQILMNLGTNAYQAMPPEGGSIVVTLDEVVVGPGRLPFLRELDPGDYFRLEVQDDGVGIDSSIRERIFEPYFTTKELGKGTGLGLSVIHGIVKSHRGHIVVRSDSERGATFQVYLPRSFDPEEVEPVRGDPLTDGSERILIVDDELPLVDVMSRILEKRGYAVTSVTSSLEALDRLRTAPGDFDLLITDMTMPELSGASLSEAALALRDDLPILMCSGFSEQIDKEEATRIGIREYVMKPILPEDLVRAVRRALDGES